MVGPGDFFKMNFKPTLWKSILSIIFGVISAIEIIELIYSSNPLHGTLEYADSMPPTTTLGIILFLIILIYIIWSLFQKKNKK